MSAVGAEDFDGLLRRAATAIEAGNTAFSRKSGSGNLSKIRFIMIDEFQDFSPLFDQLVQAIRKQNNNLQVFCVGDDWQAINGFAGSDLAYFQCFEQHNAPSTRLFITTNYRSVESVVKIGNQLM